MRSPSQRNIDRIFVFSFASFEGNDEHENGKLHSQYVSNIWMKSVLLHLEH